MPTEDSVTPTLTAEISQVLRRYLAIQEEERRLEEEKGQLKQRLAAHLRDLAGAFWYPEVDGQKLKVRCRRETQIEYDEVLLCQRLGPRYRQILKPDPHKVRRHLDELGDALAPVLELVGSPDRDRVKAAIASGVARREEFAGAFRRTARTLVAVSRFRPETDAN